MSQFSCILRSNFNQQNHCTNIVTAVSRLFILVSLKGLFANSNGSIFVKYSFIIGWEFVHNFVFSLCNGSVTVKVTWCLHKSEIKQIFISRNYQFPDIFIRNIQTDYNNRWNWSDCASVVFAFLPCHFKRALHWLHENKD